VPCFVSCYKNNREVFPDASAFYEITPEQLSLLRECLRQIESGWEVNIMQANGSPHGANAMMADTIEA